MKKFVASLLFAFVLIASGNVNAMNYYYGGPAQQSDWPDVTTTIKCPGLIVSVCFKTEGSDVWANNGDGTWDHRMFSVEPPTTDSDGVPSDDFTVMINSRNVEDPEEGE